MYFYLIHGGHEDRLVLEYSHEISATVSFFQLYHNIKFFNKIKFSSQIDQKYFNKALTYMLNRH